VSPGRSVGREPCKLGVVGSIPALAKWLFRPIYLCYLLILFMCKTDWFKQYRIKFTITGLDKFNIVCALSNVAIHNCICQLPQFQLIFPSSGVNMYGNVSTANWQRLDTCQQQTHIDENRFAPGKLFMQTDLWYTKLKLLNGDIYWFPNGNVRLC